MYSVTWLIANMGKWSSSASNLNTVVSPIVNVEQVITPMISFVTALGLLRLFPTNTLRVLHALSRMWKAKDPQVLTLRASEDPFLLKLEEELPRTWKPVWRALNPVSTIQGKSTEIYKTDNNFIKLIRLITFPNFYDFVCSPQLWLETCNINVQ